MLSNLDMMQSCFFSKNLKDVKRNYDINRLQIFTFLIRGSLCGDTSYFTFDKMIYIIVERWRYMNSRLNAAWFWTRHPARVYTDSWSCTEDMSSGLIRGYGTDALGVYLKTHRELTRYSDAHFVYIAVVRWRCEIVTSAHVVESSMDHSIQL